MRIEFHRDADREMRDAARRYEEDAEGLGERFFDAIEARLADVAKLPGIARRDPDAPSDLEIRRVLLRRFPYALVLVIESEERALVVAVAHEKREPGYWLSRLGP